MSSGMNACPVGAICTGQMVNGEFIPLEMCVERGIMTKEEYDIITMLNRRQQTFEPGKEC